MDISSEAKKKLLSEFFFIEIDNKRIYTKAENDPIVELDSIREDK